jgi:D-alanine-D-alanine ligase
MVMDRPIEVLVLSGGVDSEHEVSRRGAAAVCQGIAAAGMVAHERVVAEVTPELLATMPGDVIWPMLHGPVGEGGPVQDALVADGRPFVGCGPIAARRAMDKLTCKIEAVRACLRTLPACVLRADDTAPPFPLPVVIKPVAEGSTIGLFICHSMDEWDVARRAALDSGRVCMVEPYVPGREITVGLLTPPVDRAQPASPPPASPPARTAATASGAPPVHPALGGCEPGVATRPGRLDPLPAIEIIPAEGLYDYNAKYERNDTRYLLASQHPDPERDAAMAPAIAACVRLAESLGLRHLARADFILDAQGVPWFLEINTMPGMTDHSLLPMAAAAVGLDMAALSARIVRAALAEHAPIGR